MKVFIVVLFCCATLAYGEEEWKPKTNEEVEEIKAECLQEYPLNEEFKRKVENMEFPDYELVRKYALCYGEKLGVFSTKEGIFPVRIAKRFHGIFKVSEAIELVQSCSDKNEQGSPADVWLYRMFNCICMEYLKREQEEFPNAASV